MTGVRGRSFWETEPGEAGEKPSVSRSAHWVSVNDARVNGILHGLACYKHRDYYRGTVASFGNLFDSLTHPYQWCKKTVEMTCRVGLALVWEIENAPSSGATRRLILGF